MTEKRNEDRNVPTLRFPGFSDEWETTNLSEIGDFIGGGTPSSKIESFWKGEIPWVSSSDLSENNIYQIRKSRFITNEAIEKSATKICKAPSILIVSRVGVGKVALSLSDICTSQDFTNLINIKENEVFFTYLVSRLMHKISSNTQGTSIKGITSSEIKSQKITYPKNGAEQQKIATFLTLLDKRIETQNKIIEQLESLIKAIGQVLFNQDRYEFIHFKLGEICEIKKGEQINGSELKEIGKYPVINGGITPSGFHSKYNCDAETITISEGGNSCGYVQFNKVPFWSGGHCYSLNCVKAIVLNKYLFYYLKYSESKIMSLRVGSGLPNIQRNAICNFEVLIPNEQTQRLTINLLDVISEKLSSEIELLQLLKKQKTYLLGVMFK